MPSRSLLSIKKRNSDSYRSADHNSIAEFHIRIKILLQFLFSIKWIVLQNQDLSIWKQMHVKYLYKQAHSLPFEILSTRLLLSVLTYLRHKQTTPTYHPAKMIQNSQHELHLGLTWALMLSQTVVTQCLRSAAQGPDTKAAGPIIPSCVWLYCF